MASQRNPNLKKANEQHEYTFDHIQELKKCSEDPIHFIKTHCQVQHPIKGGIPFSLYPYQERMIEGYHNNRHVVILASRQTGKCGVDKSVISVVSILPNDVIINRVKKVILWCLDRKLFNVLLKKV